MHILYTIALVDSLVLSIFLMYTGIDLLLAHSLAFGMIAILCSTSLSSMVVAFVVSKLEDYG